MTDTPYATLTELAYQVGAVLNQEPDDDKRERLQERFETTLNEELFVGAKTRRAAGRLLSHVSTLLPFEQDARQH